MRQLRDLYYALFLIPFRVGARSWTPDINAWRGVALVTMLEGGTLIGVVLWVQKFAHIQFEFGNIWTALRIVALFGGNYWFLIGTERGPEFERDLTTSERARLWRIGVPAFVTVVGFIFLSMVFAAPSPRTR